MVCLNSWFVNSSGLFVHSVCLFVRLFMLFQCSFVRSFVNFVCLFFNSVFFVNSIFFRFCLFSLVVRSFVYSVCTFCSIVNSLRRLHILFFSSIQSSFVWMFVGFVV